MVARCLILVVFALWACGGDKGSPGHDAGADVGCGTLESCDQADNDCDGAVDEGLECGCVPACDSHADCTLQGGERQCVCANGYAGDGVTCIDVDECATDNGGCDPLVGCSNVLGGPAVCGECPVGYSAVSDSACAPVLASLLFAEGELAPDFAADTAQYAAHVPISTQTVTLTPIAPDGATVVIDGAVVTSGAVWESATLDLGDNAIVIEVREAGHPSTTYEVVVNRSAQQAYVKASNGEAFDVFGSSVALSRDTLVIGAPGEDSAATGVNGDGDDNAAPQSGAAYVFVRDADGWSQQAYLKASNTTAGDRFGTSVAISGDTIVVGAPEAERSGNWGAGAAYVFVRNGTSWSEQAALLASPVQAGGRFGTSVGVRASTFLVSKLVVGAPGIGANLLRIDEGAAYVFERSGATWSLETLLRHPVPDTYDEFGYSVAISTSSIAVGCPGDDSSASGVGGEATDYERTDSGAVFTYYEDAGEWTPPTLIKPTTVTAGDGFGRSVALHNDTLVTATLVVGSPEESSVATGVDGDATDRSATSSGAAYVFVSDSGMWTQQAYLKAHNSRTESNFGASVAVFAEWVAIGAPGEDRFGFGLNNDLGDGLRGDSGAAYVFQRELSRWRQRAYVKASNTDRSDGFGACVAVSTDLLAIGASTEDSAAAGIDGDQSSNDERDSGSAYIHALMW